MLITRIYFYIFKGSTALATCDAFCPPGSKLVVAFITGHWGLLTQLARITEFMLWIPKLRWLPSHWLPVHSHIWTLVKAHVGITAKPFHLLPHGVCSAGFEVGWAGFWQDFFHLWCWRHLRDVVAILFTWINYLNAMQVVPYPKDPVPCFHETVWYIFRPHRIPVISYLNCSWSPFLSAILSKKHQGARGESPHLTKDT